MELHALLEAWDIQSFSHTQTRQVLYVDYNTSAMGSWHGRLTCDSNGARQGNNVPISHTCLFARSTFFRVLFWTKRERIVHLALHSP